MFGMGHVNRVTDLVGNLGVIDIFAGDCGRDPRSGKRGLCCCSNCGRDTIS